MSLEILYTNTSTLPSGFEITFTVGRIVKDEPNSDGMASGRIDPSTGHVSPPARTRKPGGGSANTENDHVDRSAARAVSYSDIISGNVSLAARESEEAAAPIPEPAKPQAFLVKAAKPLRPLCLNPSECAGYGTHTCHRCLKAAGEVAA